MTGRHRATPTPLTRRAATVFTTLTATLTRGAEALYGAPRTATPHVPARTDGKP